MEKSTISMAMFNSYVKLPEGIPKHLCDTCICASANIGKSACPVPSMKFEGKSTRNSYVNLYYMILYD